MSWQTRVRAVLGIGVLMLAGGVAWYVVRQRPETATVPPVSPRTDEKAIMEIAGGTLTRADPSSGRVVFELRYDRLLSYPSSTRLVKVTGTMMRGDQPIEFRADEADIKLKAGASEDLAKFDEILMRGNVLIKSAPGPDAIHLETSEAVYNDVTGMMTTDKPAKMKRGQMSGSGTGATFDRNRSVVWLLADAKVSMVTDGQGTLAVTSTRAGLAEAEKYFRFEENVRMEREGRVITTDAALANLTPDGKRLTTLELRGKSRVTRAPRNEGGVPNMSADDITITYGAESGLLETAVLMRAARLELPEGGGKSLSAEFIELGFGGDGSTLTLLTASDAVELKIPAERDLPAREVRAPRLEARGAVPNGLDRADFSGGVEFREQSPARGKQEAVDRVGTSKTLALTLDGGFSKIKTADFSGDVSFRDKDTTATAPEARYGIDSKLLALRAGGRAVARVIQDDGTIDANEIDLTLDPRKISAKGSVRSTLKPGARKDRKDARPSILEDDQPVNITSRALDYDGATEKATYTGDVRLWQGDTNIQADTIVLDDKTGNLEARRNKELPVRGTFLIREEPRPGEKAEQRLTTARADELVYDESRRQATFRGTREQPANMQGPEGNITAPRIEVFLQADGNTLERAEAYEKVTARLEGDRTATGTRMTYLAKSRRYDMTGRPLVVTRRFTDKNAGGKVTCEKIEGASLTFDRSTDSVSVTSATGAPSRNVPISCTAIK